jgi:hemolysin III
MYLILGWSCLLFGWFVVVALPGIVLILLLAGGILYSVGVVFHVWWQLPYQNAIWHMFVLAAAGCHFIAVALAFNEIQIAALY